MNSTVSLPGLQIESALVNAQSANFVPPTWPPHDDFPVVIDANGEVVSRFGDSIWKLGPWAGVTAQLNFGDGETKGRKVSRANAEIFRLVTGWWLWGPNAVRKPLSLVQRHDTLKPIFVACTDARIAASELYRFPKIVEMAAQRVTVSKRREVLSCLHYLWLSRDELGFTILDGEGLKQFSGLIVEHNPTQTAYIPPRIWTYQVVRLKECIDDYLKHRQQIEACFRFCVNAYQQNGADVLGKTSGSRFPDKRAPFSPQNVGHVRGDCEFHGAFRLTAQRFGIDELLDRWVNTSDQSGVSSISSYLSLISRAGLAYVLNFSLMRIEEGNSLRSDCYEIERDPLGEDIHLIGGPTTKTIEDADARWIVSPSVKLAVEAMISVATLRLEAAQVNPTARVSVDEIRNPHLQTWAYEYWGASRRNWKSKKRRISYGQVVKAWPKLFDKAQLRITKEDLMLAQRITFGLDPNRFAIGAVWPLAWHQLRRSGAVNMLASGLVSDSSVQYQLKHATRAMSRYYGQNYYHVNARFDDETRAFYVREMYQTLARQFQDLQADRFISPYGDKRKAQIMGRISEKDHQGLLADAKAGRITYRENFLGGCTKLGNPCELGGISNITGCMGFRSDSPCEHLLLNKEKKSIIVSLRNNALNKMASAHPGSPLHESLQALIESSERALNVIDKN